MAATNPFVVLSYVGGPALLTNASSVFIMSTANRFARAIDRARALSLQGDTLPGEDRIAEIRLAHRRVDLIARAMQCFYFAAGMFALGTLASIAGAVVSEIQNAQIFDAVVLGAAAVGFAGFIAFITGAFNLVIESRLAARAVAIEADAALAALLGQKENA
ncbi:MAG TPA: DUF2721 domain-containing protein [Rhizomicrobium sp.]|jgi:hypothetical protein|nr:DUF2721 domain-containing protein [Rhizomicrobium sp.]